MQLRLVLTPTTEVCWAECETLGRREACLGIGVVAHGVLTSKKIRSHLGVRLGHEILIYHASAVACVVWNMLLPNLVGWSRNPVLCSSRIVSKHITVNVFARGQLYFIR